MLKKSKLWDKNFICVVLGTAFSVIGSIGLNVALSMVVYDETQSTLLSAVFIVVTNIPNIIIPLVFGSIIDRSNPLKIMIKSEAFLAIIFFISGIIVYFYGFNYLFFMFFSVAINIFGVISNISGSSIHAQIISKDNYIQGNAVINTIQPLLSVATVPLVTMLFQKYGIGIILFAHCALTVVDILIESRIDYVFEHKKTENFSFSNYLEDLKDGFNYFKSDTAIRTVFIFFSIVLFCNASSNLIYPFFENSAALGKGNYATFISFRSFGYMLGGVIHYFWKFKDEHRFRIAVFVYILFVILDSLLLFMPFEIMCLIGVVLGVTGMNSANIRVSAVAARVENNYRAKTNALFMVMITISTSFGQLLVGSLAEYLDYRIIQVGAQVIYLLATIIFILPRKNKVRELYNYSTKAS